MEESTNILHRLRSFSKELYNYDTKPLLDPAFSFPWETISKELSSIFATTINLEPQVPDWREGSDLLEGLVAPYVEWHIALPAIPGSFSIQASSADINALLAKMLKLNPTDITDTALYQQFYSFIGSQLIALSTIDPTLDTLSPKIIETQPLPSKALCYDIRSGNILLRCLFPAEFLQNWKKSRHFETQAHADIELPISCELGRSFVPLSLLKNLKVGDLFLISHAFYRPGSDEQTVFLTYKGKPLVQAQLHEGTVTIVDMAIPNEAFTGGTMTTNPESISNDTENPTWSADFDEIEHDADHQETQEEESPTTTEEEETPATTEELSSESTEEKAPPHVATPTNLAEVPLPVVVQIAELSLTANQIADLQPGSLLNTNTLPENGVALVVHGSIIATGDLIAIGDTIGVRITSIG